MNSGTYSGYNYYGGAEDQAAGMLFNFVEMGNKEMVKNLLIAVPTISKSNKEEAQKLATNKGLHEIASLIEDAINPQSFTPSYSTKKETNEKSSLPFNLSRAKKKRRI